MNRRSRHLKLLKVLLGPVLLIQGWWVRKRTPVLPEPVKQPSGTCGRGPALSLLLIGDSSAAGVGANTEAESLLGQLITRLKPHHTLSYTMLAKTGQTTADVLAELEQTVAKPYDVVISALGVNDVTSQVPVDRWLQQQQKLIACLQGKFTARLVILSGLPPVGEFPALPWPLNAFLGACADQLDHCLTQMCEEHRGVCFHSLRGYPDTATAATDGFHPGPDVYRHWAEYLVTTIGAHHQAD